MAIDVLILSNDQVLFVGAAENIKRYFGVTPKVLNGATSIAKGYNQLAKESTADILCFMHQDTRLAFTADVIEDYFKELKNPGVLGFCGSAEQIPGKQWHDCPPLYGGLTQGRGDQAKPLDFKKPEFFTVGGKIGFHPVQTLDGYCLFIKRSVFEKIGGFDEEYAGWHGYDMDICAKAINAGFQNYVIHQSSQHFSWGASGPDLDAALARYKKKWLPSVAVAPVVKKAVSSGPRKGRLKVVVYTICRDEKQFVERFMETCKDADGVYVLDTGSTDGTPDALKALGANVEVVPFDKWNTLEEYDKLVTEGRNPWRFDVARNLSIDMCPEDADVLICIDLDEVLVPGWRQIVEQAWTPGVNHMSYLFSWSMTAPYPNGKPVNPFWYEKFHSRHGYMWVQPVHEQLCSEHGFQDVRAWVKTCLVHHYADPAKSRGQYLNLLELSVREAPHSMLARFYLGREYSFKGRHDDCINSHKILLAMPDCTEPRTRGNACNQIAACYGAKGDKKEQFNWLLRATIECPHQREAWVELAFYCQVTGDNLLGYWAAKKALEIPDNACDMNYLADENAWRHRPHDIASICGWHAFNPNQREGCMEEAWKALSYSPWDMHFGDNYRVCQAILAKPYAKTDIAVDVIVLSYSKTKEKYEMTKGAIQSLRNSSSGVGMRFVVVETNTKLAEEPFAEKELFGPDIEVIFPLGPFGFNKYLNYGYGLLFGELHSTAPYIACMNNDVILFNPDFMRLMLNAMKIVPSASPLGLREATWGHVDRSVPIDVGYDINRQVNGWFLMFDKKILNALPFEQLFPEKFDWYGGDIHYAEMLDKCGYKHGLVNAAQALHLQKQSHAFREDAKPGTPADRDAMIAYLGLKGKCCVEVGVERGVYSKTILAADPASLILVDPWCHQDESVYPNDTSNAGSDEMERRFREVQDSLGKDPHVVVCRAFSIQASKACNDESFDFIYIDAIHTKVACLEDMRAWWSKVKKGGWMCGHDYHFPGVIEAVKQFLDENKLKLAFVTKEGAPSWAIQK